MAQLTKGVPENAVLAIFYDSEGDIIQIDPMGGNLYDAKHGTVQIDAAPSQPKLKDRTDLSAKREQRELRSNQPPTTVTPVHINPDCLWVDHGGRNVWRC